ncbi:amidohydrolase family protein [Allobaculum sp. Allo2]|uniref:amidohydrolase family protein n=1 Tax=Allobaculum sp. Allo2 TaxID=2853432 RepID=UPI001F61AFD2|nr:amidohydrolase family protein [Allobaculum sp. Allo2]UNT93466.1 amidohydrolase family protein [Allobaculum sp. Allo2]
MNLEFMQKTIRKARGLEDSDLVLKNANIVNVFTHTIVSKDIAINDGKITGIGSYTGKEEHDLNGAYVLPGLIDAHIHIESTLASPLRVSLPLLKRGTTVLMADPHEIVNAGGKAGLDYMLEEAALSPLDIYVMMPSSVPSTGFETNGAGDFMARDMEPYVKNHQVFGLGEVMRFHDVLNGDKCMLEILETFEGRPIDGHAPGVHGRDLMAYRLAGITSDHEAVNADEAIEKLEAGLHLFLREGSGAQNLEAILQGLIEKGVSLENCSFCTDDKHLEEIETRGHIDWCLKKAVDVGADPIEAVCMATIQSARHFGLKEHGAVAPGYLADLVIVKDLKDFEIIDVYKTESRTRRSKRNSPKPCRLQKTRKPKQSGGNALRRCITACICRRSRRTICRYSRAICTGLNSFQANCSRAMERCTSKMEKIRWPCWASVSSFFANAMEKPVLFKAVWSKGSV